MPRGASAGDMSSSSMMTRQDGLIIYGIPPGGPWSTPITPQETGI